MHTAFNKLSSATKTAFTVPKDELDWIKNKSGDIVSKDNIDSYIPTLDASIADNMAKQISAIDRANGSWDKYFNTLKKGGQGYVVDYIKNTQDLSKVTGDDLVKANQNARQAAIQHNAALKQQTLGAKAATIGMQTLKAVMNTMWWMAVIQLISECVSWLFNFNQRLEESRQEMIEAGKEAAQLTKDLDGLIEQYRKLGEDGKLDNSDREQAYGII